MRRFSKAIWGVCLLCIAAFVVINQFSGFAHLGVGTIITAVLSLIVIVGCIADLSFSFLPVPLAVMYIIFRVPLGLPYIRPWTLILAAGLAVVGLSILLPHKHRHYEYKNNSRPEGSRPRLQTQSGPNDNNPSISIHFGGLSRRLNADCLETVNLNCSFGGLEIIFDRAELAPNGAEALISCNFGAIELLVPRHWRIINRLDCTLGGVDDKSVAPRKRMHPN